MIHKIRLDFRLILGNTQLKFQSDQSYLLDIILIFIFLNY